MHHSSSLSIARINLTALVSLSPTFYEQLSCTKALCIASLYFFGERKLVIKLLVNVDDIDYWRKGIKHGGRPSEGMTAQGPKYDTPAGT